MDTTTSRIPWNRKLDVTACSIGEELGRRCVHRGNRGWQNGWPACGQRKELSRSVAGWRRDGMAFHTTKKSFPGLFCCCCFFFLVSVCSFVLKLSWCIRRLGTNIRHCLEQMRWQQDPLWFLMVTREILPWLIVGSLCTPVYPSPPKLHLIWKMSPISGGPLVGVLKNPEPLKTFVCWFVTVVVFWS